jgi:DNA-binding CsgD family transcriptional regulator
LRSLGDGEGAVFMLVGPPGIGKTSLLEAALAGCEQTVLRASGHELETGLSFGAVRELLTPAVISVAARERKALFDGPARLAAPVLGFAPRSGRTGEGDPLYGLFWLVAALAERQPLVLAVDDMHWFDVESALFAVYLARRVAGLPILVLATARADEPGSDADTLAAFRDHADVLALRPLSRDGVARLVPGRPAQDVHRLTGGNPLLVAELERALADADDDVALDAVAPESVGRAVLARVARISPAAVALARAVALSSDALTLADAAELAELDADAAGAGADALIRAEVLVVDGGALRFMHPVMRTAVYEELGPFERRGGHARAARLLADRGADIEAIAAHLLAGEPAGDPQNVRFLRAAAENALSRMAPRAAIRYLQRALVEPMPAGSERVGIRYEVGRLQHAVGDAGAIATLQAALEEAEGLDQFADVGLELSETLMDADRPHDAMAVLGRVLGRGDLDAERRVDADALNLGAAMDLMLAPDEVARLAARIPPDLPGDTPAQRRALIWLAYHRLVAGGSTEEANALLERVQDEVIGRESIRAGDVLSLMRVTSVAGSVELAETLAQEVTELARETGMDALYGAAQLQLAVSANQCGRLRECEAALRLGLASPGLQAGMRLSLEDWLVTTLSMQGRFAEAEELLDRIVTVQGNLSAAMLDRRRFELALDRGDHAAALEPGRRLIEAAEGRIPPATSIYSDYAIALNAVGEHEEARQVAHRALDAALRAGEPHAIGAAHCALGRVLPRKQGLAHLEQAVAVLRETPLRWSLANAELALGAALRRDNQRARAREMLASALDYAARNGAAPIEEQARAELRLTGARPRRAVRTGVDALTPSEDRIARLAAEGMSNKDIAAHLFLTVKTVEMHLGSAYRKLDVGSRRELPARFAAAA